MKTFKFILISLLASLALPELPAQQPPPANFQAEMAARMKARREAMAARAAAAGGVPGAPGGAAPGALGTLPSKSPIQTDPNIAPASRGAAGTGATAAPGSGEEMIPADTIDFEGVDVNQVLEVYAKLVHRTLLRGNIPQASIVLKTETALTKNEVIEALQAVLSLNGIAVVNFGDKFVKVGATTDANTFGAEFNQSDASHLPDLGPYVTHIVQLKYLKPSIVMPLITPFAKLPNAVIAIEDNGILVLRDNSENVKRMLEMIDKIDVSVPAEYISEVIPIRYAQASDIASALNSLGGSGGGTVSIGGQNGSRVNGVRGGGSSGFGGTGGSSGGFNGLSGGGGAGGYGGSSGFGGGASPYGSTGATANGTPTSGTSFQDRLSSIINRAGGGANGGPGGKGDAIQVFGETKIIADQRSNSLLIFATRQDMENIKHVISQLDVLLAQVLIEAVIMDVNLDSGFSLGTSVAQNPQSYGNAAGAPIVGAGGFNNGTGFLSTLTNGAGSSFANNLTSGNGFSYFGNIGPNWDVAVTALASADNGTIIQRPRIQTSQAKPATFFVGNTVPYITGSYYGSAYGNSSSYSQLSVGVELDVTPFINPDGLVVMDINQEIDDVSGFTPIDGNNVPNTDKRTLNSEIAVRDQDTIMLGGFIRSEHDKDKSGVPLLEDIPILGSLFSSRSDTKKREELVVLMRPTVMKTPEDASAQTLREERRLPAVSAAAADDAAYERQLVAAERKAEKDRAKKNGEADGFYNADDTILQTDRIGINTNAPTLTPAPAPSPVYQFTPIIQSPPAPAAAPGQPAPNQPAPTQAPPSQPGQPVVPN